MSYNTLYTYSLILTWGVVGDSHKKYCIPPPHPPVRKLTLQSNIIVCGHLYLWWEYYIYGLIAIIISFIGILLVQFYPFFFRQHSFSFVIWWAGRRAMFSLWRSWPGTITAPSYRRNRPAPTSVLPLFLLSACHAGLTAREKDTQLNTERENTVNVAFASAVSGFFIVITRKRLQRTWKFKMAAVQRKFILGNTLALWCCLFVQFSRNRSQHILRYAAL